MSRSRSNIRCMRKIMDRTNSRRRSRNRNRRRSRSRSRNRSRKNLAKLNESTAAWNFFLKWS